MVNERKILAQHNIWEKNILKRAFKQTGLRVTSNFLKKERNEANTLIEDIDRSAGLVEGNLKSDINKYQYFGEILSILQKTSLQTSKKLFSKIYQFQNKLGDPKDQEQLVSIFELLKRNIESLLENIMQLSYPYLPDTFTFDWIKDWKEKNDREDLGLPVGNDNLLWGESLRSESGLHPKMTIKSDGYRRNNLSNDPQYICNRSFSTDPDDVFAEQNTKYYYNKLPLLTVDKKYYAPDDLRYNESEWSEIKIVARANDQRNAYLMVSFTPDGSMKKEVIHEDKVFDGDNYKIHQVLNSLENIISESDLEKIDVKKLWQLAKIYMDKGRPLDKDFYNSILGSSELSDLNQPLILKSEVIEPELIGKSFEGLVNADARPKINTKYLLSTDGSLSELPEIPLSKETIDRYMFKSSTTLSPLKRDDVRFQPGLFESISFMGPQNNFRMRVGVLRSDDGNLERVIELNVLSDRPDKSDAIISFFEDGTVQVEDFDCADWEILERQKAEMSNKNWRLPLFKNVPKNIRFEETLNRFIDAAKKSEIPMNTLELIVL